MRLFGNKKRLSFEPEIENEVIFDFAGDVVDICGSRVTFAK